MTVDTRSHLSHLRKILERNSPFSMTKSEGNNDIITFIRNEAKILVIGCGGLGCELIKNLALMGFVNISVIDMDTIELSNLNRQFLFREKDIGLSKAEVAAKFINSKIPGVKVEPHFCRIEDKGPEFYQQFHIIVSGLDSVPARRWINSMVVSLLNYVDGELDQSSIIPLVDGGTEGFKGNSRVILPGLTSCIECTLDLFPPQITFPLCTLANTPRLPEHCIEYVRVLQWNAEKPFGDVPIDGDDPNHIQWIHEKSLERAQRFNIDGVTYRLTQGVIRRIMPAVASTNAIIASSCATEVFKLATSCCSPMNNYMIFNDSDGIYSYTYEAERNPNCITCSRAPQPLEFQLDTKLEVVVNYLMNDSKLKMKSPGITTCLNGKNRTLYMKSVAVIEQATRENLKKTLGELGLKNGQELAVADVTRPNTVIFVLKI